MTFRSAYLKLTFFYVLIVMIISLTFSAVLYGISSRELDFGFRRQTRALQNIPPDGGPRPFPNLERMRSEQLDQSNRNLKTDLIYFNLLILILSGALSYFLARRTLKPIEEMMDAQSRFTADASHELRTPLTAMKTEIEVGLRDKNLDTNNTKALLISNLEEIAKLDRLSNALLELAQYENNKNIVFEKVSLEDVITQAYGSVEKSAEAKEIKFKNKLVDIKIKGDESSLVELFVILIDNAIKYSHKKSKIFLSINHSKKFAIVKIKDQGMGVKASDLPYIFNRFYRSDPSRSKIKTDGYGLGLSIAQKIIELHKGSIKVDSQPTEGSIFTVSLPLS